MNVLYILTTGGQRHVSSPGVKINTWRIKRKQSGSIPRYNILLLGMKQVPKVSQHVFVIEK
jgi:hypothetical protein